MIMPVKVKDIYRYPVKGLSAERLSSVPLVAGEIIPGDRRFALAHGTAPFDATDPHWLPKRNFLMLAKNEKLAQLESHFDPETEELTIFRGGKQISKGKTTDIMGRTLLGQFFASFMAGDTRGTPRLVEAEGFSFADTQKKVISILNLASVEDLERVVREKVSPLRFRANIHLAGLKAWQERSWIGRELAIGPVRLKVLEEIERCAATNVNPQTGARDLNIPLTLRKGYRHMNMGIYAEVLSSGDIAEGTAVELL